MLRLPNLSKAIEKGLRNERDDWNTSKIHISDLGIAIGEGCERQLWLRLNGSKPKPKTAGQLLMLDHAKEIHDRIVPIIKRGLSDKWQITGVEERVTIGDMVGRYDMKIEGDGVVIIVDFKTVRGNAFNYLRNTKPSHAIQIQGYMLAENAHVGACLYIDREGQNGTRQFKVKRNDHEVKQALKRLTYIAELAHAPEILRASVQPTYNKKSTALRLKLPWCCSYCDYRPHDCEGSFKSEWENLGIVAHIKDGQFIPNEKELVSYHDADEIVKYVAKIA